MNKITQAYVSITARLKSAITGMVPPKEVEDILQEAYVRACKAEDKTEIEAPRAFLLQTVKNLALDHLKRSETRLTDEFNDDDLQEYDLHALGSDPLGEAISHERFALFCDAVRKLPAQSRRAFVLKKVYGYSRREIAEHMGVSENTVQTQIARAMKACMLYMEMYETEGVSDNVVEMKTKKKVSGQKPSEDVLK